MGTSPTIRANDSVPSAMANDSCFMSLLFYCVSATIGLVVVAGVEPANVLGITSGYPFPAYHDATGCPEEAKSKIP